MTKINAAEIMNILKVPVEVRKEFLDFSKIKDTDFDERNFPTVKSDILPNLPVTSTSAFVENLMPE